MKYYSKAKKTEVDGHKFDSKKEAVRYQELKLLERAGKIQNLQIQPRFQLSNHATTVKYPNGRIAAYTADFEYLDLETGQLVTEDVKGSWVTDIAKLRMAVFEAIYLRKVTIV